MNAPYGNYPIVRPKQIKHFREQSIWVGASRKKLGGEIEDSRATHSKEKDREK